MQGLNGEAPLKRNIQIAESEKVGGVSVVYATNDKDLAEQCYVWCGAEWLWDIRFYSEKLLSAVVVETVIEEAVTVYR